MIALNPYNTITQGKVCLMSLPEKERALLRTLAETLRTAAESEIQRERTALWYAHNDLTPGTRPLVFCDPEGGWREIVREADLLCETERGRAIERELRIRTFYASMRHDRVDSAVWRVGYVHTNSGWGLSPEMHRSKPTGAASWTAPIRDYAEDMRLLHAPEITVDADETRRRLEFYTELFDGILSVELFSSWWWSLGLTQTFVYLRGLEQMMYDMYDEPENVHALMRFLSDGTMRMLDFLEENRLLFPNNGDTYVGSGGFGWTKQLPQSGFAGATRLKDMWGFAESQETVNISPDMFEEFIFPYQLPILKRFGLNCYGCCEPLDKRWHVVQKIPSLRRVSVSAWADFGRMAELLGGDYVYSCKPNPAFLAVPELDEDAVRAYLRPIVSVCRAHGCRLELIMKDCHTIGGNPQNVLRWCEIASEEAQR